MSQNDTETRLNAHAEAMRATYWFDIVVGPYRSEDLDDLNDLMQQLNPGTSRRFSVDSVLALQRHRGQLIVCRTMLKRIVGMVVLTDCHDGTISFGTIEHLSVDEACHDQEIERMLVTRAVTLSAQRGQTELRLTSAPGDKTNVLYQQLGFINVEANTYCRRSERSFAPTAD